MYIGRPCMCMIHCNIYCWTQLFSISNFKANCYIVFRFIMGKLLMTTITAKMFFTSTIIDPCYRPWPSIIMACKVKCKIMFVYHQGNLIYNSFTLYMQESLDDNYRLQALLLTSILNISTFKVKCKCSLTIRPFSSSRLKTFWSIVQLSHFLRSARRSLQTFLFLFCFFFFLIFLYRHLRLSISPLFFNQSRWNLACW